MEWADSPAAFVPLVLEQAPDSRPNLLLNHQFEPLPSAPLLSHAPTQLLSLALYLPLVTLASLPPQDYLPASPSHRRHCFRPPWPPLRRAQPRPLTPLPSQAALQLPPPSLAPVPPPLDFCVPLSQQEALARQLPRT